MTTSAEVVALATMFEMLREIHGALAWGRGA